MKPPCYNCKDRHELCHSKCHKYKDFKTERERISEARQKIHKIDNYIIGSFNKVKKEAVNRR